MIAHKLILNRTRLSTENKYLQSTNVSDICSATPFEAKGQQQPKGELNKALTVKGALGVRGRFPGSVVESCAV